MNYLSGVLTGGLVIGLMVYVIMAKSVCVFGHCIVF